MTQDQTAETPANPGEEQHPLAGLKVVVTIHDDNAALIGVSRGAVDPHIEPVAISPHDELASILGYVPEVLDRALQRWEGQPRFPNYQAPTPATRTPAQRQQTNLGRGGRQPQDQADAPRMF